MTAISPLLWVGTGPAHSVRVQERCATAPEAVGAIQREHIAIVPTKDVAHQVLLLLGSDQQWANYAVGYAKYDFDADLDLDRTIELM